ncbi:MAG: prepilin peptidase [Subdoligranulum variabile]|nr:prepilin peptidase [Subdoligranulum variabile]
MEWIIAVCSVGLNLAAVWFVQKKTGLKPEKQTQWAAALLLAAAGGFASGYMLVLRAGTYPPNLLRLVLLGTLLTAAAYIDALSHKIPNWIVLCTAAVFAGCTVLDFVLSGTDAVPMALNSVLAAAVFFVVFFLVRLASRGGVGYGDIKMITAAALILGIYGTFSFLLVSHVLAAVAAIALLVSKKATRKDGLPFGPFFYLGYLVTILTGMF